MLSLTLFEAWAIRDFMRRHQEYGCVWDRRDMLAVHAAVLHLEAHKEQSTYDLVVDADTLWLMEQQIPSALTVGTTQVGRMLLLKVMAALQEAARPAENHDDDEPSAEALPGYVQAFIDERDRAQRGFEEWGVA